jgi:methionine-rich copper-binding protein CopC
VSKLSAGVLLLSTLFPAGQAFAHAHLQSSVPAAGSTVTAAPHSVTLSFSEALEPRFSSIVVTGATGTRVDKNDLSVAPGDAKTVRVDLDALTPGPYTVMWCAVSVDTHRTHGSFSFSVTR